MKKILLSILIIGAFVVYAILVKSGNTPVEVSNTTTGNTPVTVDDDIKVFTDNTPTATTTTNVVNVTKPPVVVTKPPVLVVKPPVIQKYKDGTFNGNAEDAYYGTIQVSATLKADKITDVAFLQYPNDRDNSVRINTRAMPILKSEAILIQDAKVNIVSGATFSSRAFIKSMGSALDSALN